MRDRAVAQQQKQYVLPHQFPSNLKLLRINQEMICWCFFCTGEIEGGQNYMFLF
jgi:hypothetical protein